MNSKHSPKKVTLAMIKGKPITTSVPAIHYHASDDELEEIYPSTDEEQRLTPEFERVSLNVSSSPSKSVKTKSTNDFNTSESNSDSQYVVAENAIPEGTPPSLDPWKVFSEIKGKITRTFEEKLSEIKNDKKKPCRSRAESSSISESEDQGNNTPCEEKVGDKQISESAAAIALGKATPGRYVGFSGVKTGLKDKILQDESIESGIEASEFSQDIGDDIVSCSKSDSPITKSPESNDYANVQKQSHIHQSVLPKRINVKTIFSHLIKQLIYQVTYRSVAVLVAVFCISYVTPLPDYLLGLVVGIFTTITFYDTVTKLKQILTTLPDEKLVYRPTIIPVLEIPAVEEHAVVERFQGWVNELPYSYEPNNYHVARTKSVFFRLQGNILRIMETRMKVPKKAVWDESKHKLKFVKRRVYNLNGAKIDLLPSGLTRKRRWSKKYPICITLRKGALVCSVNLKGSVNDENSKKENEPTKTGSNKKCTANETRLSTVEDEESVVGRDGEQEEEEADTAEDDDNGENYNNDFNNDDIDNNEYAELFENWEAEGWCAEEEKGDEKERDAKVRRNGKKGRSNHRYVDKKGKKRRTEPIEMKVGIRSNVGKENEIKGERKEDCKKHDHEEEGEEEEEEEEEDEDEDDEFDNDDYDYYYIYNDEEEEEEVDVDYNDGKGNEDDNSGAADEKAEMRQREAKEEKWETLDEVTQFKRRRKSTLKKRLNNEEQRDELKIFIFARADREKEDWYRRLVSAASRCVKKQDTLLFATDPSSTCSTTSTSQRTVVAESKTFVSVNNSFESLTELTYNAYMAKYLDAGPSTTEDTFSLYTDNTLWINCLIARVLFDVHRCPETINLIQDKIQRKLSSIKLPYFMECLLVSEVAIGQGAPIIRNVTKPVTNERGLWFDLDVMYKGSLTMTVETKLNLMKLKRSGSVPATTTGGDVIIPTEKHDSVTRSPIFDSDIEDTPETSTEDDDSNAIQLDNTAKETTPAQSSGKKFLSMVDRIAANKFFQHATELSYVRKAMEGVSNMEIRLMVTISSIEGCLSLNIPPAPSDRLWYGFKPVPKVTLTVKPAVGERKVNFVSVTKWIETKLLREFEKLVVLPNMDDFVLPLCPNYPYTTIR
ncbi:testis-expressed protein 2 [Hylaeus volcanicus]|uniref:testis-expressed protein 2 n=1 Tax=Hylaeus volcanicus TaxID=313075 RepID=UPI0023B7A51F|nr:testis-expressed protein 2 [Hylaeus volcanicus]